MSSGDTHPTWRHRSVSLHPTPAVCWVRDVKRITWNPCRAHSDVHVSCCTHLLFCGLLDRPPPDGFPVVDGHPAGELPPPWPFPAPGLPPLPPPPPLPLLPPLHVPPPPPPLRPPRRARTSGISLIGAFAFGESAVHLTADASAASQTRTKATTFITQQRPLKHLRMRSGPCGEGSGMRQRHGAATSVGFGCAAPGRAGSG